MTNKLKTLFVIIFPILLFLSALSPVFSQENDDIRVAGFGGGRTRFVLADQNGGAPPGFFFPTMSRMYFGLTSAANFGANGEIACEISRLNNLTVSVTSGGLVSSDGSLLFDVFWGPPIDTPLSEEEAVELAKFVKAGGVLFVGGAGWQDSTPGQGFEYNLLFEKLGIEDRFDTDATTIVVSETDTPLDSIVTSGPFGEIESLTLGTYRRFNRDSLRGIVSHPDSNEFVVHENRVGKGYIVVAGTPFFANPLIERNGNNLKYSLTSLLLAVINLGKIIL